MKYRILVDYYTEGYKLDDQEFDTIEQLLKHTQENPMYNPFLIIQIINDYKVQLPEQL